MIMIVARSPRIRRKAISSLVGEQAGSASSALTLSVIRIAADVPVTDTL
jgi:hypothetical protein